MTLCLGDPGFEPALCPAGKTEEEELVFRLGLSWLRMVKDSEPSFRPERTKLIVITYSVSERRPLKVLL